MTESPPTRTMPMVPTEARVALVTGGGRGIGAAISRALAGAGHAVAVNYRRDEEAARATVDTIVASGGRAAAYRASVDVWEEDEAMVSAVTDQLGPIGILVNNAGIASRGHPVADTDPAELERVIRTHAFGAHFVTKLALPSMRTTGRGDIVMISSAATRDMAPYSAPYNMAKAALEALAFTVAKEEQLNGIRANVVAPGLVTTEMGDRLVRATMGASDAAALDASTPFGRVCRPEDVAATVTFLVSDAGGQITGQRIIVDGGGFVRR